MQLLAAVDPIRATGGTNMSAGLELAFKLLQEDDTKQFGLKRIML